MCARSPQDIGRHRLVLQASKGIAVAGEDEEAGRHSVEDIEERAQQDGGHAALEAFQGALTEHDGRLWASRGLGPSVFVQGVFARREVPPAQTNDEKAKRVGRRGNGGSSFVLDGVGALVEGGMEHERSE